MIVDVIVIKLLSVYFTAVIRIEIAARALAADCSYIAHVIELVYQWNLSSLLDLIRAINCLIFECFD